MTGVLIIVKLIGACCYIRFILANLILISSFVPLSLSSPLSFSLSLSSSPLLFLLTCIVILMNNQQSVVARQLHLEGHCLLLYTTNR